MTSIDLSKLQGYRMVDKLNYSHIGDHRRRFELELQKLELLQNDHAQGSPLPEELFAQLKEAYDKGQYKLCAHLADYGRNYLAQSSMPMSEVIRREIDVTLDTLLGSAREIGHEARFKPKSSR